MCQLIESIKVYNGKVYNIAYHNQRCNRSRKLLFQQEDAINLRNYIHVPTHFQQGLVKCKITYHKEVETVDFEAYTIRRIQKVAIVKIGDITYAHKYANRAALSKIRIENNDFDEIIMIKNGFVTDAYYYNVVIEKDGQLLTPSTSLLKGTMQAKLLAQGKIKESQLTVAHLKEAEAIYLINALTPLKKVGLTKDQLFC